MSEYIEGEIEPGSIDDPFLGIVTLDSLIRHYRHRSGISRRKLSKESGVKLSTLRKIEKGKIRYPDESVLASLSKAISSHVDSDSETILELINCCLEESRILDKRNSLE